MFKRRPLNKDKNNSQGNQETQEPKQQAQQQSQQPAKQGQNPQQQQHPSRQRHKSRRHGGGGNQQGNQQGQNQGQQRHSKNRRNNNRRGHQHRPPAPPPFMQRDVLLLANKEISRPIEEVRSKFDPLSKKIPAHVTILFSESSDKINREILKKLNITQLPAVNTLTFKSVEVISDKYLWLIPDEESADKLKKWHEEFRKLLPDNHTQGEKYEPHLTLGYIPRKTPEEDALAFARNIITTPLTVNFDTVLLEEFSEDQTSRSLDRLQVVL